LKFRKKFLIVYLAARPVQHVVHHYAPSSCCGSCELCCPWKEESSERRPRSRSRSRSPTPPTHDQQRHSRRDEFDRSKYDNKLEAIDEKIERLRRELNLNSSSKQEKSTETIDYYHPPPTAPPVEHHIPYKQHYDPPKPRSRSRSRSRPRSASSLPREPWRSSNQNDYPWRDAHLPAYREATLARAQTPTNESHTWKETAHERSHLNTQTSTSCHSTKDYIYKPSSETEARKWYTQSTGKDPNREVHQALHGGTTSCNYTGSSTPHCGRSFYSGVPSTPHCGHSFYSDVPSTTTTHSLKKMDSTQYHNLYGCNESCLHIIPKQGTSLDPPYLKIYNAPVTYLH